MNLKPTACAPVFFCWISHCGCSHQRVALWIASWWRIETVSWDLLKNSGIFQGTLAECEWHAAAPGLKPLRLPRAPHLWDPDSAVGELGGGASLPSSACIAFLRLAPFHKTSTDFVSQPFYIISTFVPQWFPLFVPDLEVWYLNLKVSPTDRECN